MADVFLSYASEDRDQAEQLAHALESAGFTVWWDRHIIIGEAYDIAIERELKTARSVIVLWSSSSIVSEWVKNEADVAADRGVLLPVLIEQVELPLEFRRKQTADLSGWCADPEHSGFQALLRGIGALSRQRVTVEPRAMGRPIRRSQRKAVGVLLAVMVLVGGAASITWMTLSSDDIPTDLVDRADVPDSRIPVTELVAGTYYGSVVADSKGGARNGVTVTLAKVDAWTVRVTSDYARIEPMEITIDRFENTVIQAGGDTAFYLRLDKNPVELSFSPVGEFNYSGTRINE